jgi:hypothetical protein
VSLPRSDGQYDIEVPNDGDNLQLREGEFRVQAEILRFYVSEGTHLKFELSRISGEEKPATLR